MTGTRRPSSWDLTAARDKTIPDVAGPGLRVLFSGINPGLHSAATGYHFARPGNRFWPALYAAGFTDRVLRPDEQQDLLPLGLGITNVVARATARADELTADEVRAGGRVLAARSRALRPRWLAVVGITVYRTAFGRPGRDDRPAGRDAGRCPGLGAAQPERAQRALERRRPGRRVRPAARGRRLRPGPAPSRPARIPLSRPEPDPRPGVSPDPPGSPGGPAGRLRVYA